MGVQGLTTYIAENSKIYLKPYKLCNCYLVIDGSNVAHDLYKWMSKSYSAFGGDYDEYYNNIKDFFLMLRKCNVTPIVLFDGGYKKKKIKTALSRIGRKLSVLRAYSRGFSKSKFYPLFMKQTFFDVMEDLGIFCMQCDLEADGEIAAVARALNCPVLSYDSDFFIYNVLYIPFSSFYSEPVKFDNSDNYYARCSIYDVRNFLNQFTGLDKSLLPILATLLGNDYIESALLQKFFGHVIIPKNKDKPYNLRKIHGVLHWLKKENVESAKKLILTHIENKSAGKVLNAIQANIDYYTSSCVSEPIANELSNQIHGIRLDKRDFMINLPPEILQLYCHCKIHKLIIDILTLGTYITQLQIENVFDQSSHFPSLQLISDMYTILIPYTHRVSKLKLYLIMKNHYDAVKIEEDQSSELSKINLHDVLQLPKEGRLKLLCQIACIDENDLNIVSSNNWSIFIMSFIYWIRKLNNLISLTHIHALILMAIANQVVQRYVGYFRNLSEFTKRKGKLLNKLKGTPVTTGQYKNFKEMLAGVTQYEKLFIQSILLPHRRTTEKGISKYCISTIHLFGCFQSCLFHIMQLNALLNFPLPQIKISDFYSGTLLFNFYLIIKSKPQVENFGCNLFESAPNLYKIYVYLYERLCKYSEKVPAEVRKPQKKKSAKNCRSKRNEEEVIFYTTDIDDDLEYTDENNPYAILHSFRI